MKYKEKVEENFGIASLVMNSTQPIEKTKNKDFSEVFFGIGMNQALGMNIIHNQATCKQKVKRVRRFKR